MRHLGLLFLKSVPETAERTLSTLARVLAEVSTYCTPHSSALLRASSTGTCLRSSKSDLFPTTSNGILSSSALTRRICSLRHYRKNEANENEMLSKAELLCLRHVPRAHSLEPVITRQGFSKSGSENDLECSLQMPVSGRHGCPTEANVCMGALHFNRVPNLW